MPSGKRSFIDPAKCRRCPSCPPQEECPTRSITREDEEDPWFVDSGCSGCGQCTRRCPYAAIRLI
ncbi:MAG: hypothetical protein D9V47_08930 [Clostridia bacterium]|nr:MAG: hypothetical protein D9V47_08930 [Clostridia bacterium]